MTDDPAPSVLSRKTQAQRLHDAQKLAPEKALCVAILRACDKGMGLHASAGAIKGGVVALAEVLESLPEKGFVATLTGPGSAMGLIALDVNALSALVEHLTMGRVLQAEPEPRRATRTDGALLRDWIADILSGLVGEIVDAADEPVQAIKAAAPFDGYGFGALLPDTRPLALMLEDVPYRSLDVTVAFGDAARAGRILLALVDRPPPAEPVDTSARSESWKREMNATLLKARAELAAVLHRTELPIGRLRRLKPGDMIAIPASAIGEVRMEASDETVVALARLGQSMGQRAVRLVTPSGQAAPFAVDGQPRGLPAPDAQADDADDIGLDRVPVTEAPDIEMPNLPTFDIDDIEDATLDDADTDQDSLKSGDDALPDLDDFPSLEDLPDLGDLAAAGSDFPKLDDLPRID